LKPEQHDNKTLEDTIEEYVSRAIGKYGKNLPRSKHNTLKEFEQDIIEDLMERFDFQTLSDTNEILFYEKGVYKSGGEKKIAIEAEKLFSEISSKQVREIQDHIRRRTMKDREEFDKDPHIINLKNCLLDLRTFETLEHTPVYPSLTQISVKYDKNARCPNTLHFIKTTFRGSDAKVALSLMGCALEGKNEYQVAGLLVGNGNNGKGVFQNLNLRFFGLKNTSALSLHDLEKDRFASSQLSGKLFNVCGDLPVKPISDTSIFKKIVGGDLIMAQKKFGQPFNFIPKAILLFSTNKLPETPDKTRGFFRRWITIPFLNNFDGKEDRSLLAMLTTDEELSGYLNLLLESIKWMKRTGKFTGLESIEKREKTYNRMQNSVESFTEECVEAKSGNYVSKDDMYEAYVSYCQHNNIPTESKETFGKSFKIGHAGTRPTINGNRTYVWKDLSIVKTQQKED